MALKYDPEFEAAAAPILEMMAQMPKPAVHDWKSRREGVKASFGALLAAMPGFPDTERTEYKFKSFDGTELCIYHIAKKGTATTSGPAVLHIHGGGMIAGDTATFSKICEAGASTTGIPFFDVEYRLAPEQQGTSLVEDCYAGLLWLHEHAKEFNVDASRIAVMGESAGGGIAAGLALYARDKQLQPPIAKQILVYPMIDYTKTEPFPALSKYLVWTEESNLTGWTALLGDKIKSGDVSPYASPAHVKDVSGLPSTYIDCGTLDLFRDEDTEYARRLAAANVDVEYHLYPGVPHGFEAIAPNITASKQATANRMKALMSF